MFKELEEDEGSVNFEDADEGKPDHEEDDHFLQGGRRKTDGKDEVFPDNLSWFTTAVQNIHQTSSYSEGIGEVW